MNVWPLSKHTARAHYAGGDGSESFPRPLFVFHFISCLTPLTSEKTLLLAGRISAAGNAISKRQHCTRSPCRTFRAVTSPGLFKPHHLKEEHSILFYYAFFFHMKPAARALGQGNLATPPQGLGKLTPDQTKTAEFPVLSHSVLY